MPYADPVLLPMRSHRPPLPVPPQAPTVDPLIFPLLSVMLGDNRETWEREPFPPRHTPG